MKSEIQIVDRGRGPQLSTSRVTVQDLVPYFQDGCSYEEIIHWIPTLTQEEIAIVDRFYQEHKEELDEQDRRIRERSAQRKNSPEIEAFLRLGQEKMAVLREEFKKKKQERNGDNAFG
jgi:uncharacterized protein (DUF433 family)